MAEKITVPGIIKMKHQGKKITCLTAYDYSFARILDEAGVDVLQVQERASHETGSSQQRQRKRKLEAEQPAPHCTTSHSFGRSAGSVLQRLLHIRP